VAANAPSQVTNKAVVSRGGEIITTNDTANDVTTIQTPPDLTVTKTHPLDFFQSEIGATYTITVGNSGGYATTGLVTVTDTLPAGLTATAMSGSGWTVNLATLTATRSDALATTGSYPLTFNVNVANNAAPMGNSAQ